MATTVRITETYDLKTTVNKMGIIGIHTPSDSLLRKLYPGLMKNHKFVRFVKCDVIGACASVLPADPLQVGVSAGAIAPEDMFNPILYTAVTNESFDNLVNMIYAGARPGALGSLSTEELASAVDSFKVYYALLSENGRFRKAMPQAGFGMRGLVPICHTLISTYGNLSKIGNSTFSDGDADDVTVPDLTKVQTVTDSIEAADSTILDKAVIFRGKSVRMPKIPLHYGLENATDDYPVNIPETFVGCIIVPPAKLNEFYYRMRVTWTVRFEQVVSEASLLWRTPLEQIGGAGYYQSYNFTRSESDLPAKESSIDADGVDIEKVMES